MPDELTPKEKALIELYATPAEDPKGSDPIDPAALAAPVVPAVVEAPPAAPVVPPVVPQAAEIPPVPPVVPAVVEAPKAVAVETEDGFEITLAADSPLSDEDLNDIFALAEKKNLDKDETMSLIKNKEDFYNKGKSTVMDQANKVLKAQEDEYLADPLFSTPAARTANEAIIDEALKKFGSPKLHEKILKSHLKNDVELAKFFHKIGETMKADDLRMTGSGNHAPIVKVTTAEDRLKLSYPEHFNN